MKAFILLLTCVFALAHPFSMPIPKFSTPQQEVIAQFSEEIKYSSLKIALVMPKKIIGRYSVASIDTIMAYLASRGMDFELEVFDSKDEESASIQSIYQQILDKDFQFAIAIFTTKGAYEISKLPLKIPFYIPTVNATQINFDSNTNPMLFFGGINYKNQIQELLKLHEGSHILAYSDDSPVGERLALALQELVPTMQNQTITNQDAATFNKQAKLQEKLIEDADVFLNTPVVKSGLLLSQIGYFRKKASKFLSTQINYNPSITVLTQKRDRKNLYIASSIGKANQKLIEYGSLLNSDLQFDWVNYATALGIEMFFRIVFPDSLPYFQETLLDNQIQYQTKVYSIDNKGFFIPVDLSLFHPKPLPEPTIEQQTPQEDFNTLDSQNHLESQIPQAPQEIPYEAQPNQDSASQLQENVQEDQISKQGFQTPHQDEVPLTHSS